jgi:uncharacterized protein YozE (UPF0346 family)
MTQVINNIYETGEWPKDLTDFKMNDCLKEEAKSYKMLWPLHDKLYHTYSKDSSKDT